jgi:hypothetical protein
MADFTGRVRNTGRRGFVVVPLVALLAVVLIGLSVAFWQLAPAGGGAGGGPGGMTAYQKGKSAGAPLGGVVVAVLFFFAAGKIADRKSQGTATLICAPILGLACVAYSINLYRAVNAKPAGAGGAGGAGGVAAAPVAAAPRPGASGSQGPMNVPQQAGSGVRPAPVPPAGTPSPEPTPTPAAQRPATAPAPARAAPPAAEQRPAAAVEAERLLRASVDGELEAVRGKIQELGTIAGGGVGRNRQQLEKQKAAAEEVRTKAVALSDRLKKLDDEAKAALKAAGDAEHEAFGRGVRLSQEYSMRAFTLGQAGGLAEKMEQEAAMLLEKYSKWKLNAAKEVESADKELEREARSLRFFIKADAGRVAGWVKDLEGKK